MVKLGKAFAQINRQLEKMHRLQTETRSSPLRSRVWGVGFRLWALKV